MVRQNEDVGGTKRREPQYDARCSAKGQAYGEVNYGCSAEDRVCVEVHDGCSAEDGSYGDVHDVYSAEGGAYGEVHERLPLEVTEKMQAVSPMFYEEERYISCQNIALIS